MSSADLERIDGPVTSRLRLERSRLERSSCFLCIFLLSYKTASAAGSERGCDSGYRLSLTDTKGANTLRTGARIQELQPVDVPTGGFPMDQEQLLNLIDDPTCQLMMKSDHVNRDDELALLWSVHPLFSFEEEMRLLVSHDQRRWVSDRRRNIGTLEEGENDRRRVPDRRQRPVLAPESPQYWLH